MDTQTIVAILGVTLSLGAAAVALGRYFSQNQRQIELLRAEIKSLQEQAQTLKTVVTAPPPKAARDLFSQLMELSTQASNAVKAEIHSISVPIPANSPTDLKIILSTDPEAAKIVGREFPITKGIAGWVFKTQQPYFRNRANSDPRHFGLVDKAAGTHSGEGAILTVPLASGGRCHGVIQFMKSRSGEFTEEDIDIAMRWVPQLTRLLIELEQSPQEDIPSIARGNIITTSVLFSDITGFSNIASKIRLNTAVDLLNEYYSRLLPIATSRGGKLQEYVGDGLYISFSLSSPAASVRAAVTSAIEMQEEYQKVLESWIQYAHPASTLNVHNIGIATSFVYCGMMGHPQHRKEKLVGQAVNLAEHLCHKAKEQGGGVIVCSQTAEIIKLDNFELKPLDSREGQCYQVTSKK
jgi:class 3 adenylate cyclase